MCTLMLRTIRDSTSSWTIALVSGGSCLSLTQSRLVFCFMIRHLLIMFRVSGLLSRSSTENIWWKTFEFAAFETVRNQSWCNASSAEQPSSCSWKEIPSSSWRCYTLCSRIRVKGTSRSHELSAYYHLLINDTLPTKYLIDVRCKPLKGKIRELLRTRNDPLSFLLRNTDSASTTTRRLRVLTTNPETPEVT